LPSAKIYAFDTDPMARKLCRTMADANQVSNRLNIAGKCDVEQLKILLADRALIVCDCEGYEIDLLRPDLISMLKSTDILVELHDWLNPVISESILTRFNSTHNIELVTCVERDPELFPLLDFLDAKDRRLAVSEFRPQGQQWAFMTSKRTQTKYC
jgi:hypothetical protein